jgi:release factor glutamine methyltransferase
MAMQAKTAEQAAGQVLEGIASRLEKVSETPGLDAQVLLARVLDRPRAWVISHPETVLPRGRLAALEALVLRLEQGEPLPYILGGWEFYGLEFEVTPDVLIPRPETEVLVDRAIAWLRKRPPGCLALDIGTGSGCIAVSLAVNLPELQVAATDISSMALDVARRNAERNHVDGRIQFHCHDLFPNGGRFDLIAANLPYIPTETLLKLPIYGREPTLALDGGSDGLAIIRRLIAEVPERLATGGLLLMEIEASQGPAVLSLAYDAFTDANICLYRDLAGRDRLLEVQV